MPHSPEGLAFLTRLNALPDGPGAKLDDVLQPALNDEQALRRLFAQDKGNTRLQNPHVGLVEVFGPNTDVLRKTRSRIVDYEGEESLSGHYIMPLKESQRRKDGETSMVTDIDEFRKNWAIFTEGSLSQLFDWSNVIAAGGSVLSALLPLTKENKKSKRAIRKYYHSAAFPSSDIDLFLWGMTPEQAEKKIAMIYEAVRDSVPWDVTCIRTKHTVSIHSQYPYRSVQIVLRLYQSPAEVLAGFDIDAPCCAYDGERVWANPRALVAMIRQCNTIDVTRRSPSYEVRLTKYAKRGFEIYVPGLKRQDIDPTIYERSIVKIEGLARLLVLEKLNNPDARYAFLESRRQLRGRPYALHRPTSKKKRRYKGDLKTEIAGLEMNDYDVASLHIPYGSGWDARRIEKLIYQTDLGMNSTFNPKNKGRRLHRHPAFFGTIEECMEDCCEHCPQPIDEDERKLQKEEDERFVRGRISFIEENPGRQTLSGSFNPIDEGEWAEQVYIRPIQKLFQAIAAHDIALVRSLLEQNRVNKTIDLQNRDHVGRTALHLAILVRNEEIAKLLVDEGCRMIARIVDGRTALHMAAQYGMDSLIEAMFEKSKANKEDSEKKTLRKARVDEDQEMKDGNTPPRTTTDTERPSSEDDWSSDENDGKLDDSMEVDSVDDGDEYVDCEDENLDKTEATQKSKKEQEVESQPDGEVPEDGDEPDVLDVNAGDWDQGFTPLCFAILYSTRSTVDLLLQHGADPNQAAVASGDSWTTKKNLLPLYLTIVRSESDVDTGVSIAERLINAGASASAADNELMTILHYAVFPRKAKVLNMFLQKDPGAKAALDFPKMKSGNSKFPVVSAIATGAYASLLTLLAHGAKVNPTGADVGRAKAICKSTDTRLWGWSGVQDYSRMIHTPIEAAIAQGDYIIDVLLENDADPNVGTLVALGPYAQAQDKKTILDWVVDALKFDVPNYIKDRKKECEELDEKIQSQTYTPLTERPTSWKEYLEDFFANYTATSNKQNVKFNLQQKKSKLTMLQRLEKTKAYLQHVRDALESMGAKTWEEKTDDSEEPQMRQRALQASRIATGGGSNDQPKSRFMFLSRNYRREWVPVDQSARYDELFEAAYRGDDATIERLCVLSSDDTNSSIIPVQITVEAIIPGPSNTGAGLTPLSAAVAGRRWSTARLIMGIAAAQYDGKDDEEKEDLQAALFDLADEEEAEVDDNDSDCDCDSCYSGGTVDGRKRQTKFVDIAKKISLRTDIHPSSLLNTTLVWALNGGVVRTTPLLKAAKENDFEAFVHLFNIQDSIKAKSPNHTQDESILNTILQVDNPKFLDELIRRKGVGINIETLRKTPGEDHPVALNDHNRLYLGLNIHGKKRADLARKGDPNATHTEQKDTPLVWDAIRSGAKLIVEYLASEKPLIAYKHFAANGEGDRAEWLRHSKSLDESLKEWLGWTLNPIGESPLAMAVLANKKELLSVLFSKEPKLMGSALHTKVKFVGFNLVLLAANKGCDKEIFEFLLKRGVSPSEVDSIDRWNIYHWLCKTRKSALLEYLLETLPREVSEELLGQRTKEKLNTPLHIAIKEGSITIVGLILNFTKDGLLAYDALGFTPLHLAIKNGNVAIVELLLKFLPSEGLYLENGVGKTPYEDAEKRAMHLVTETVRTGSPASLGRDVSAIYTDSVKLEARGGATLTRRKEIEQQEEELQSVKETLQLLIDSGVLQKGSVLSTSFEKFVSASERRLEELKAEAAIAKAEVEDTENATKSSESVQDVRDPIRTFGAITKVVGSNTTKRILIHLKDVQKSVAIDLNRLGNNKGKFYYRRDFEDEEVETPEEDKGVIRRSIVTGSDSW